MSKDLFDELLDGSEFENESSKAGEFSLRPSGAPKTDTPFSSSSDFELPSFAQGGSQSTSVSELSSDSFALPNDTLPGDSFALPTQPTSSSSVSFTQDSDFSLPFSSSDEEAGDSFDEEDQEVVMDFPGFGGEDLEDEEDLGDDDWSWSEDSEDAEFEDPEPQNEDPHIGVDEQPDETPVETAPTAPKPRKKGASSLWASIKKDFGIDSDSDDEDGANDAEEEEDPAAEDEQEERTPAKKNRGKGKSKTSLFKKLLSFLLLPYDLLRRANAFILNKLLWLISFVPVVGNVIKKTLKPFVPLASRILPAVEILVVLGFIPLSVNGFNSSVAELPDEGKIIVSAVEDSDNGASVHVVNDGEIVSEGSVSLVVSGWKPSLFSPKSWFTATTEATECSSEVFQIEPDQELDVEVTCEQTHKPLVEHFEGVFNEH